MGPRDGEGDPREKAEGLIKKFLEEKGRPLDPEKVIQRWELLRRDVGLTDKDLSTILGRALFGDRLKVIQTLDDLASFIDTMEAVVDRWFERQALTASQGKETQKTGPNDGDGPIPKEVDNGRI